jgi:hypothetical protein
VRSGGCVGARERRNVPDWRDESAYPTPDDLSDRLWRWEFIRRMCDYRAAWDKASEREYEIMGRMAADSNRDMSGSLTPDSVYFTVARAVYSCREEFGDLVKYRNHPFPNPRLSALQVPQGGIGSIR